MGKQILGPRGTSAKGNTLDLDVAAIVDVADDDAAFAANLGLYARLRGDRLGLLAYIGV